MTQPVRVVVEVTDTLSIGFTTGIQRVVREVVTGLQGPAGDGLEVVPVVTPAVGADFRRLTPDESDQLRVHPPGGRAGRRADDFGPLSPVVRRIGDLPVTLRARAAAARFRRHRREVMPLHRELSLGPVQRDRQWTDAVFLDVEGSWYDPTPRATLLPELRRAGAHPMVLVCDVMPILFPQWFTPQHVAVFRSWLLAHLHSSEMVLAISERTANDLRSVLAAERARGADLPGEIEIRTVPLGTDHAVLTPEPVELPPGADRFVLVVGTLEPRKNQRVVLDAFDRLRAEHPELTLVLVGKEGWMVDDLVRRLRTHPASGHRLVWLGGIDDAQLAWLYEHAFLTIAPSIYEGLGVPVMEALDRGCPTISSTGGALVQAGAGLTELFEPTDTDELVALLRRHLDDPAHHEQRRALTATYSSPTWDQTSTVVATSIRDLVRRRSTHRHPGEDAVDH